MLNKEKEARKAAYLQSARIEGSSDAIPLRSNCGIRNPPYSAFSPLTKIRIDNSMYVPSEEKFYLYSNTNKALNGVMNMRAK